MYGFCGGEEGFRGAVTERRIGDMFEIGEYVVYGVKGVCRIEDITHIDISGADKNRLYYVLAPIGDANGKIYVPTDNQKIVIRRVISKEEAEKLIQELPEIELCGCRTTTRERQNTKRRSAPVITTRGSAS